MSLPDAEKKRRHYESTKRWALANPERIRQIKKRYGERHRLVLAEKRRRYMRENKERQREIQRRWVAANSLKVHAIARKSRLFRRFNMTLAEYETRLTAQGGRCAICGDLPIKHLAIDHDHATGHLRELLCRQCNTMLGKSRDSVEILQRALAYVIRHRETATTSEAALMRYRTGA